MGAFAVVLAACCVTEVLHAVGIIADPVAGMVALFHQLLRLLPW
jgi:hypothetical protein